MPGGKKRSYVLKQVCLTTYDLLLPPGIKVLHAFSSSVALRYTRSRLDSTEIIWKLHICSTYVVFPLGKELVLVEQFSESRSGIPNYLQSNACLK